MTQTTGQVIFRSSRQVTVRVADEEWSCELRGLMRRDGRGTVVVGDVVTVEPDGPGKGRVMKVHPRRSQLSRRRESGGARELVVAANIDQVVAVFAARQPKLKFGALDRVLVAAAYNDLPALIVINKSDLQLPAQQRERLDVYPRIGYRVLEVSAEAQQGVDRLRDELHGRASVVAGPSGVGKSSLLSLLTGLELRVGEVSHANEKGKHTTTAVNWYPLPGEPGADAGAAVDTPGFRDYALWGIEPPHIAPLMPDLAPFVPRCRFSNCLHLEEPGCGVIAAVEADEVTFERYRSYVGILDSVLEQRD
ncbi:MAG: ribosome small subunit-dependent GTPase A [Planctomycetota bacterium]